MLTSLKIKKLVSRIKSAQEGKLIRIKSAKED